MKILIAVGRVIPPLFIGGAEVSLRILVKKLTRNKHHLHIIGSSSHPRHGESAEYSQHIHNELVRKNIAARENSQGHYVYTYCGATCEIVPRRMLYAKFEEHLLQCSPDIVITMLEGAARFVEISKTYDIKVALWVHDVYPENIKALAAEPNYALYTSEYVRKKCNEEHHTMGVVFYPPFEKPVLSKLDIMQQRNYITMINPIPEKGGKTFISLSKEMSEKQFLAVEGWRKSELFDNDIPDNLTYVKRMDDLSKVWDITSILLVPSNLYEGFGRVVIEAGYFGIPSIVLNTGGLPEAVGESGIILKENTTIELKKAIMRVETNIDAFRIIAYQNAVKYDIDHESIIIDLLH